MSANRIPSNFKRLLKPWAAVLHLALMGFGLALFLGRRSGLFRSDTLVTHVPDFYLHVSNASISLLLYAGVGYFWLMLGVSIRHLALAGVLLIVGNFVYELFVPILNTTDVVDAWYGVAGVLCGFITLWIVDRRGMVPRPAASATE